VGRPRSGYATSPPPTSRSLGEGPNRFAADRLKVEAGLAEPLEPARGSQPAPDPMYKSIEMLRSGLLLGARSARMPPVDRSGRSPAGGEDK
jgi:hypothetical protein